MVRMRYVSDATLLRHHEATAAELERRGIQPPQTTTTTTTTTTAVDDTEFVSSSRTSRVIYTPDGSERDDASVSDYITFTPIGSDTGSERGGAPPSRARPQYVSVGSKMAPQVELYTSNHGIFESWLKKDAFQCMPLSAYQRTGSLGGLVDRAKAVAARRPHAIPANVITALRQSIVIRELVSGEYKVLHAPPGSVLDEGNKQHEAIQDILKECLRILSAAHAQG